MLTLINLEVIQQILKSSKTKISASAQMLYINCLMHHFKDKKPTAINNLPFEILHSSFNYQKYYPLICQLHYGGLVILREKSIYFHDLWNQYIDFDFEQKSSGVTFTPVEKYKDELLNSNKLKMFAQKTYRFSEDAFIKSVEQFVLETSATEQTYQMYRQCATHFVNWLGKRNAVISPSGTKTTTGSTTYR